jgi:hypothetical protein
MNLHKEGLLVFFKKNLRIFSQQKGIDESIALRNSKEIT